MNRLGSVALVLACLLGCCGCINWDFRGTSSNRIHIETDDEDALQPGLKVSLVVAPRPAEPRRGLFGGHDGGAMGFGPGLPDAGRSASAGPDRTGVSDATGGLGPRRDDGRAVGPSPASREPRESKTGFSPGVVSVDLDYFMAVGAEGDRLLLDPAFVDYDGARFSAPQLLNYDFDLHVASLGVRAGPRFFDVFALEGVAGFSTTVLDLEVRGASRRAGDTGVALGAHFGGRATLTPHWLVDFYGEWKIHLLGALKSRRNEVWLNAAEAGAKLHLSSNLSLFGGWRWSKYEEDIDRGSDMDLEFAGPSMGLALRF